MILTGSGFNLCQRLGKLIKDVARAEVSTFFTRKTKREHMTKDRSNVIR